MAENEPYAVWSNEHKCWWVNCGTCGAQGPRETTGAEAIAAWNRRADAIPLSAALAHPEVRALVETAQWARNRLETIADESWYGDGRDLKRSIIGVFADFDEALAALGSAVPPRPRPHPRGRG
jgi:hypothetical protein